MNVLVIGRGGREHALCDALRKGPSVERVFCAPGNTGIAGIVQTVDIAETDFDGLISFSKENKIDLAVVGPEVPLLEGIADAFKKEGIRVFGPDKRAAVIEGSKSFAKELMKKYSIPTAAYETFSDFESAKEYVLKSGAPIVIKADGLAAGKGVVVAQTVDEALDALEQMLLQSKFGEASAKVVIEEFLEGEEFSLMAFVDGENVYPMEAAQDHKRAYNGDQGPNTGGMGAYSPVPHISTSVINEAVQTILIPTANAMKAEGRPFKGILYAGLIVTSQGPKVIEFNARFGDPETQVVLPRLRSDLAQVFYNICEGKKVTLEWDECGAAGVVLAAEGYPEAYKKSVPIHGLDLLNDETLVYHAGTCLDENARLVSNGGRVLLIASKQPQLEEALKRVYSEIGKLDIDGLFYRTDIGRRAIERASSALSE
ncbi:phosphoribosylamine--glycine ligase [Rossellomorea vietnamensis]|uniref:Phosphoribosylamine--glycine ligase n=1 Tax=Rossellomorea vietnamensis TaxID=218284 RepID=A0A5D4KAB8_9BACI|nr:phosphoribosylamine--glycine ligase [Rossellomorea vietnamensis]TYR73650.1 phosphoribosylamine--glycine ligase [Rossellomorea vietnamensis]